MPRENSPWIVGDYWLDKRRDGRSPDIWQIATYSPKRRTVVYSSTHKRGLDDAKAVLEAHVAEQRSKTRQSPDEAQVLPMLMTYWTEHGRKAVNADQTGRSIRTFIGFLMQDEAGVGAVVTDLTPALFERFREWRMGPHGLVLEWAGETVTYASKGVAGATVQRNINDIRAAVHHAEANLRIPMAPRIKDLDRRYASKLRERVLTIEEMGKIAWYCSHSPELFRFVTLQFATAIRPMAAMKFNPARQYDDRAGLIDQQPDASPQTKKRNAIIPAIRPVRPVLRAWAREGARPVSSHKTAWRIMRRVLGLTPDVHPKTIRHTVATMLYSDESVPERQVTELLAHEGQLARTTRVYAKYSPHRLRDACRALSTLWLEVSREARRFGAVHSLSTGQRGDPFRLVKKGEKC